MALGRFRRLVLGSGMSGVDNGDDTITLSGPNDATIVTTDVTTNNVTSTKHGWAPKSPADATKFLNGAATPAYAQVKDSDLSTSDITTNDVSTSKHGFTPKAPNDTAKFLRGDGTWAVVGGVTSVVATDTIWDAKGDLAVGTGADAAVRLPVGSEGQVPTSNAAASAGIAWLGTMVKLADTTLGADAANVDLTSISASYAHLLLIWYARSDRAASVSDSMGLRINNDSGGNYYYQRIQAFAATLNTQQNVAATRFEAGPLPAASSTAGFFGGGEVLIPHYAGTTNRKAVLMRGVTSQDTGAGNGPWIMQTGGEYDSASAVSRLTLFPITGTNLKAGTRVTLYGLSV